MQQAVEYRTDHTRSDHRALADQHRQWPGRAPDPVPQVVVGIHAADPLTRAGIVHHLDRFPGIALREQGRAEDVDVAVVVAETVDGTTVQTLRRLTRGGPARIVLVAGQIREPELLDVVECGVRTILWRQEAGPAQLRRAVLAAARGEGGDLPSDLLGRLLAQVGRMQRGPVGDSAAPAGLGERETEVLRLVADGLDTVEIAARLSYSERTIKVILHGVTSRLQLRNRAHAVAYALREGHI